MKENKSEMVILRMSKDDKDILSAKADSVGLTKSEYIRKLIRDKNIIITTNSKNDKEKNLAYEVYKIGVNINQIVHNVNMNRYSEYEKKKLFALMTKIIEKIENM